MATFLSNLTIIILYISTFTCIASICITCMDETNAKKQEEQIIPIIVALVSFCLMIISIYTMFCGIKKETFYDSEYDVYKMAQDFHAKEHIEEISKEYKEKYNPESKIEHVKFYGLNDWTIYKYSVKEDSYLLYKRSKKN